jgi:phosphoesterase RecJ-like protein
MNEISPIIREKAPLILAEIKKASSILLHCHPSPDPDSVGSALAMKFAVEQLGKKAIVIKGDSEIPQAFMHFPGADSIVMKNFTEIDLNDFDLFLSLDTASLDRVSTLGPIAVPSTLTVVDIDHHPTNPSFGSINLVESSYPATAQILFDLFNEWNITITPAIATNLFMGIYSDTGGFKYRGTTPASLNVASKLVTIATDFADTIAKMENSNTIGDIHFRGLALSSLEPVLDGAMGIATVSHASIKKKGIPDASVGAGYISSILRSVGEFKIVAALIEAEPNRVRMSFRSQNAEMYDVSKIAAAFGGGGHKAAAGAGMRASLAEAKQKVVDKAKELYNI